jgi:chemotaxis protein methyltransferase CheR
MQQTPVPMPEASPAAPPNTPPVKAPANQTAAIWDIVSPTHVPLLKNRGQADIVFDAIKAGDDAVQQLSANDLCAAALLFLETEDYSKADTVISYSENCCKKRRIKIAVMYFLRGEYYYYRNNYTDAEDSYKEAASLDEAFWPAFYRLAVIAASGDPALYRHKVKKALEAVELGKSSMYEIFIGGFSPDYYRRAMEKRL